MIRNVLFDIGQVLLPFNRDDTVREFSYYSPEAGPGGLKRGQVFLPDAMKRLEAGRMSGLEYYRRMIEASGCELSYRHFELIWTRYFTLSVPMIRFGRHLSKKYRIYFLSNTSSLHIPPLYDRFPELLFFHGQALSYELGVLKPAPAFFTRAMELLRLEPSECIFIDDKLANVKAARGIGIRAVHHTDSGTSVRELTRMLGLHGHGA